MQFLTSLQVFTGIYSFIYTVRNIRSELEKEQQNQEGQKVC